VPPAIRGAGVGDDRSTDKPAPGAKADHEPRVVTGVPWCRGASAGRLRSGDAAAAVGCFHGCSSSTLRNSF